MRATLLSFCLALGAACAQDSPLERKVCGVEPTEQEARWLKIPWEQNLAKARLEAQRQNKPLFVWIMDGNVLGNT